MHLKKITLKNFRCFETFELELHPRLTVIVAENGGGKTSILDGIAIGLAPILRYLSSANQRLTGPGFKDTDFCLIRSEGKGDEKWVASDFAQVMLESTSGLAWDQSATSSKGKGKQPPEKLGQTHLAAYASEVLDSITTDTPKLLPIFAYYGARRGWIEVPERIRDSKVNYEYPTAALFESLKSLTDFKEMLKWFDLEESSELRSNRESNPEDWLLSPALDEVRSAITSLLGGRYSQPRFNKNHKFVIQSDTTPAELQVSQLSQGYQSMLALGMDFARRLALGNSHAHFLDEAVADWQLEASQYVHQWMPNREDIAPMGPAWAPAIMLVDEIDLHLHPEWQQRVLDDLMRTFPGTQFIVATHSPQVVSTVPSECLRIIKDGKRYKAPAGTDGAEAQRILETVFQVHRRPDTEMARALDEYLRLINQRKWETPHALDLRARLDKWSQGQEPRLLEADLQIENLKWEMGK
jgi:predicted ATP-binding protein involved in virulence